jgi:chromosome segregation ATPase
LYGKGRPIPAHWDKIRLDGGQNDSHHGQIAGRNDKTTTGKGAGPMQEIAELERRITAALERIGRGVETLSIAPASDAASELPASMAEAELARLTEALDEERMANAQLNERLRVVRDKDGSEKAALEAQIADLAGQLEGQSTELTRLRRVVDQLNGELADLRDVAERGVTEPEHINKAMLAELQALRSARASEAEELAEIVAALNPLIAEARQDA